MKIKFVRVSDSFSVYSRHLQCKEGFDLASSETHWVSTMTAQPRGWIEADVLRDDGLGEEAGWAEIDGSVDRWRDGERQRGAEGGDDCSQRWRNEVVKNDRCTDERWSS